jgi:hypothetical protein
MMSSHRNDADFGKIFGGRQAAELHEDRMREEAFNYRSLKQANETVPKNESSIKEVLRNTTKVVKSPYIRKTN